MNLTVVEASKGLQLSGIKKEKGKEYLVTTIALQINTALEMLQSYQTTPDAIAAAAEMIVDEFWMMKLDEILLAFKRGTMGRYGKIYGAISLNLFFEWINAYNAEQAGEFSELLEQREKENWNKKFEGSANDAEVFSALSSNEKFKHQSPEQRVGKPISIKEMLEENEKKNIETIEAIQLAVEKGIIAQEQIDKKINPPHK